MWRAFFACRSPVLLAQACPFSAELICTLLKLCPHCCPDSSGLCPSLAFTTLCCLLTSRRNLCGGQRAVCGSGVRPWRRKGRKQNPQREAHKPCRPGRVWASPVPARAAFTGQKGLGPDPSTPLLCSVLG